MAEWTWNSDHLVPQEQERRETCPICDNPLYSVVTRRVGDTAVCITCGDMLLPLTNAIARGIIERVSDAEKTRERRDDHTVCIGDFVAYEVRENFMPLIDNGADLLKMLRPSRR